MDRRVTPPGRVISPTWGPPPPCKQALNFAASSLRRFTGSFGHKSLIKTVKCSCFKEKIFSSKPMIWYDCEIDLCDLHITQFMICRSHPLRYFCEEKFDLNYASVTASVNILGSLHCLLQCHGKNCELRTATGHNSLIQTVKCSLVKEKFL